jgi:hypothetical protein
MKKILFATMAGAAAVITIAPANAADLGLRPMDAAPPAFTWSGCYIGGNIGGGLGTRDRLYSQSRSNNGSAGTSGCFPPLGYG